MGAFDSQWTLGDSLGTAADAGSGLAAPAPSFGTPGGTDFSSLLGSTLSGLGSIASNAADKYLNAKYADPSATAAAAKPASVTVTPQPFPPWLILAGVAGAVVVAYLLIEK